MAEVVTAAVALATAGVKLAEVLTKLGKFLRDVKGDDLEIKNDVEMLRKELTWMNSFLLDAKNKPGNRNSNVFKTWVAEVSQLVTESETTADKINLLALEQQRISQNGSCMSLSCCFSDHNTNLSSTRELRIEIKKLLSDSENIAIRRNRYDPNVEAGNSSGTKIVDAKLMELRRTTPNTNDEHMVGHDESVKDLIAKLMNRKSGLFMITIVGMGGLGKTTLARKLFQNLSSQHFTTCAWVCVSQVYNTKDIFMELINIMTRPTKQDREALTSISLMETYLHKYLTGHRFLVVIDDVWEREAWESLKRAFPCNPTNGSKVIITTRNERVATLNNAYVHKLRYLDENESWDLFCRKALPRGMKCPSYLEQVGKEMVAKCSGLPLAIVVLGGLLFGKSLILSKWNIVRDNLWKELENESIQINAILTLSFEDLPEHLKQCFLYIAMFPEDFPIETSRLMLLWEAEGFIKNDEEAYCGDATKSYFEELVGRCLFSKTGGDWIRSVFRVHDLLRDLAIRKSREIGLSVIYDGKGTFDVSKAPFHTRLALFDHPHINDISAEYTNISLNTFFGYQVTETNYNLHLHEVIQTLQERFQNLRVLHVQMPTASSMHIPSSIGDLIHLRFLGFECNSPDEHEYEIPDTIRNLKVLQTLSMITLPGSRIRVPKKVLINMTHVKHLIGNYDFLSDKIGSFVCLETLEGITGTQWCRLDTTNLVNIRRLRLYGFKKVSERFHDNFKNLLKLQTLILDWKSVKYNSDISLEKIFELCPSISHLLTRGKNFHHSLSLDRFAVNLVVLECDLPTAQFKDVISSFGKLPQLEALYLSLFYMKQIEVIRVNEGFAQLRFLKISGIGSRFIASVDCMPLLEHLETVGPLTFQGPDRMMRLLNR